MSIQYNQHRQKLNEFDIRQEGLISPTVCDHGVLTAVNFMESNIVNLPVNDILLVLLKWSQLFLVESKLTVTECF